jgi:signal transduction histidine kinase
MPAPCGMNPSCYDEVEVWVLGNALVGWSTIAAGLVAWFRRPGTPGGRLLTAAGFAWFLGAVSWASNDGGAFQGYYVLLVSVLVLTYPSGRIGDRASLLLLVALGVTLASSTFGRLVFMQNVSISGNCDPTDPTCTKIPSDLFGNAIPGFELYNTLDYAYRFVLGLEIVGVLAVILHRFVMSTRPNRRVLLPPVAMAAALAAAIGLAVARRSTGFDPSLADTFLVGVVIALTALPHAFTWDLVRGRLARGAVADLVVQLARPATPDVLGASLGRALGDPSLSVLVWSPEAGAYLDEAGHPAELPTRDGSRATTLLARENVPIGALVHDPALRLNAELLRSVSAAAALTIDNMRLAAEVQAQLDEVRASRARIVAAGLEERQRLERDLHDGAQQQLVTLAIALREARSRVDAATDPELARSLGDAAERAMSAVVELRELARGIHPPVLTEAGLTAALDSLAARAPLPVAVDAPLPEGLAPAVAATAYFVVAEALTNVAKHAHAHRAHVRAEIVDGRLRIEVDDDGVGGADIAGGTGLRGLADRVAALGGSISVQSPPGGGTRLVAEIPCAS